MSTTVTLNGVTYTYETDFTGSDGYAWTKPKSPGTTGNVLFSLLNDFLSEVVTSKAGIASVSGVSPSSAGNVLLSDGANWVRSHSSGVTALLDALTVSGASSLQAVTATSVSVSGTGTTPFSAVTTATVAQLSLDTTAGNATDATQIAFRRAGAAKWTVGNNVATGSDAFDWHNGSVVSMSLSHAGALTIASGLTVTAGGITVSAGGITASGQTVTASNFVGNWAGYGNNLPSGPFAGAPDSIIGLSTSTVQRYTAGGLVNFLGGKQTITGSKGANAALASLLTGLVALGLVTDSTT